MESVDTPVLLVVKAPNQRIGDQTIECALGWTVQKLKTYLSEVYPSKPKTEDQKLIYSGQLLHDHLMLKDILRQYDHNNTHIVHLVCTPTREFQRQLPVTEKNSRPEVQTSSEAPPVISNQISNDFENVTNSEVLRHRVANAASSGQFSNVPQAMPSPEYPMYAPSYCVPPMPGLPLTPEQVAQQMLWMQQMYAQYMSQYMQYVQTGTFPAPTTAESATPIVLPTDAPANHNVQQQRPAANENVRMNAQGGPVDDDDDEFGPNRDWLDWFYILSRAAVLFSIVYFYSSLSRLVAVTLMAAVFYFYQVGWFTVRRRARPPQEIPNPQQNVHAEPQQNPEVPNDDNNNRAHRDVDANEEQMRRETQEIENLMDNDLDNPIILAAPLPGPSILSVTWTFVTGFFSSLIPEQPAHVN